MNKEEEKQFDNNFENKLWSDPDSLAIRQNNKVKDFIDKYYISKSKYERNLEKSYLQGYNDAEEYKK